MVQATRLSAHDASFLYVESDTAFMQDGAMCLFERLGLTAEELQQRFARRVARMAILRKRLYEIPGQIAHPVLVEDPSFDIRAHIRTISTPRPYDLVRARYLATQLLSVSMDRTKPLWGVWIFDMQGERTGIIVVVHHCLLDGMGALHTLQTLLTDNPLDSGGQEQGMSQASAEAPSQLELLSHGIRHAIGSRVRAMSHLAKLARRSTKPSLMAGGSARSSEDRTSSLRERVDRVWKNLDILGGASPSSPLSAPVGRVRSFETTSLDLELVKAIKNEHDCTVNDVVLALFTAGLREVLIANGIPARAWKSRAAVPVSTAGPGTEGESGNRVSSLFIDLPVHQNDPFERLRTIANAMTSLKNSRAAAGFSAFMAVAELAPPFAMRHFSRLVARRPQSDVLVSNIRGPTESLSLFGAKLLECYPCAPVLSTSNISATVMSYAGTLYFGITSDPACVPDLSRLSAGINTESKILANGTSVSTTKTRSRIS